MPQKKRIAGFTLVELLVVIAIIGVLVSLLLPAVNSAREAARRTQCMNGVRQMGLALVNHESATSVYPSGGMVPWPRIEDYRLNGKALGARKQGMSWAFQLLPYLEEGSIQDIVSTLQIEQTRVALYNCPSRRSPTQSSVGAWLMDYVSLQPIPVTGQESMTQQKWEQLIRDDPANGNFACKIGYGFWGRESSMPFNPLPRKNLGTSYTGFQGVIVRSSYFVTPNSGSDTMDHDPRSVDNGGDVTFLGYVKNVSPRKIKDGLSKTGIICEKHVKIRDYIVPAAADDRGWSDGWDLDTQGLAICPPQNDSASGLSGDAHNMATGSAHSGGMNCVYGDCAVHFLNFDIDPVVLNRIANRHDGQIVGDDG